MNPVSPAETAIVKDLMSKHNLTPKDLFSFCICAVNFLEYYMEESMYDVMWGCPERYENADSDNTRAVAGALNGEKKSEHWTDEEQFAHYMHAIQETVDSDKDDMEHFLEEYRRFAKVYKREILVPVMLGCPVEDYDDSRFDDEEYIESIVNADNLTLVKAHEEQRAADLKKFEEEEAARLAKEVESKKDDKDFSVLLASITDIVRMKKYYEEYNETYYPDRDYKVIPMPNPQYMIIQTGGKSIEDVKETVLKILKSHFQLIGPNGDAKEELKPVEDVWNVIPQVILDNKVTHVVAYY